MDVLYGLPMAPNILPLFPYWGKFNYGRLLLEVKVLFTSAVIILDGSTTSSNSTTNSNPAAKDAVEHYHSLYTSPIKYK